KRETLSITRGGSGEASRRPGLRSVRPACVVAHSLDGGIDGPCLAVDFLPVADLEEDDRQPPSLDGIGRSSFTRASSPSLHEQGVDPHAADQSGERALILAARKGRGPIVRVLIDGGA